MGVAVSNLTFGYSLAPIVESLSFDWPESSVMLEGPSGCGKSTLLKLLSGLETPWVVDRFDVPRPARLILQDDALFGWQSVDEALNLVPGWRWPTLGPVAELGLLVEPIRSKRVHTLSFGQRRSVELLRVLATPAPLVCLDEPLNFLDPHLRRATTRAITDVVESGSMVVLSSHHRADFSSWPGRIATFDGTLPVHRLHEVVR